jgi:UDPglucose 6-dehydrogenase
MEKEYKIAVAGLGYVGLSNSILLAQHNHVVAVDIIESKVNLINDRKSPIVDTEIERFLASEKLNLVATTDAELAYKGADFIIITTPTNYDDQNNHFDTSSIEAVIDKVIKVNCGVPIIIKSTIPLGYTKLLRQKYNYNNIIFSPEFLREGKALYDNLYPSRIIVGISDEDERLKDVAKVYTELLIEGAIKKDTSVLYIGDSEAEAVKLFSNAYLALRVSFFNELDTLAEVRNLNVKNIIDGICLDSRIGNYYNNPSFGYGGYCLPKDIKQLISSYDGISKHVLDGVVKSNFYRKEFIAGRIMERVSTIRQEKWINRSEDKSVIIGFYRLNMKFNSDNFRESSIQDVIKKIKFKDVVIVIYEPSLIETDFDGNRLITDINEFKEICDIIVTNRYDSKLDDVCDKLYTRDIYIRD